jgi:hypothetical protein
MSGCIYPRILFTLPYAYNIHPSFLVDEYSTALYNFIIHVNPMPSGDAVLNYYMWIYTAVWIPEVCRLQNFVTFKWWRNDPRHYLITMNLPECFRRADCVYQMDAVTPAHCALCLRQPTKHDGRSLTREVQSLFSFSAAAERRGRRRSKESSCTFHRRNSTGEVSTALHEAHSPLNCGNYVPRIIVIQEHVTN